MKKGDRIELVDMPEDPHPVPRGTQGTVTWVNRLDGWMQIGVDWDDGRSLMLCVPPDQFRVLR